MDSDRRVDKDFRIGGFAFPSCFALARAFDTASLTMFRNFRRCGANLYIYIVEFRSWNSETYTCKQRNLAYALIIYCCPKGLPASDHNSYIYMNNSGPVE